MKINRLEAHDRLLHFKKDQSLNIAQGAEDCLKRNPDSIRMQQYCPYVYLFAHPRTADDGVNKRMLWQPRLIKPKSQTNSYLFRAISNTDLIEIIWFLPPHEMWAQFKKGNVTEAEHVLISIENYTNHRHLLDMPHKDDISDEQARNIYIKIAKEIDEENAMKKGTNLILS